MIWTCIVITTMHFFIALNYISNKKEEDAQSCALELKPPPFNLKNNIAHMVPLIVGITFSRECAYSHNC